MRLSGTPRLRLLLAATVLAAPAVLAAAPSAAAGTEAADVCGAQPSDYIGDLGNDTEPFAGTMSGAHKDELPFTITPAAGSYNSVIVEIKDRDVADDITINSFRLDVDSTGHGTPGFSTPYGDATGDAVTCDGGNSRVTKITGNVDGSAFTVERQ